MKDKIKTRLECVISRVYVLPEKQAMLDCQKRIIYCCWKTRTCYDEAKYLLALKDRN